jgi:predicted patatin/cPLA2 family phospholipase
MLRISKPTQKKRGLVISGGGSKGAFAGGILEYLIKEKQMSWDTLVGTSTGNLLCPLTSLSKIDKLKDVYTNVSNKDIFSINPFNKKGSIKILNAVWRIIRGKTSLGEAGKLRKKIEELFTQEEFNETIKNRKDIFSCVTNYTKNTTEFKHQKECDWQSFCDWMLASASVPIGFDLVRKDGCEYLDGGVTVHVPIQKAIDEDCDEIDVIILREENPAPEKWKAKSILNVFMQTIDIMQEKISFDDVEIGKLLSNKETIKLNFYYTPYKLTDNSIFFNKEEMLKWWKEGYDYAKGIGCKQIVMKKSGRFYEKVF